MIGGFWNDARLFPPPKDGSSYLLMARIDAEGERPWPVVGHWDPGDEWRSSGREYATTYGSIKSILQNGLDRAFAKPNTPDASPIRHANIRGRGYYH